MIIRLRDAVKLLGIIIMCACAAVPCTLFMNSNVDMAQIKDLITTEEDMVLYDATIASGNVTIAITGGALAVTTVVLLFFYIKNYIDAHKSELGILKALGYSAFRIAKSFWVFGLSVFAGTCIGFGIAFAMMPMFYREMRKDWTLAEVPLNFNPILLLWIIILPTIVFSLLSVFYGYLKLKRPALELIRGKGKIRKSKQVRIQADNSRPFLKDLKQSTVKSRPSLVFFIGFASFCYSDMVQMSMSMKDLASEMMALMMFIIGLALAFTALFIAISTVIRGNGKTLAMLRVFGYSDKECAVAVLNGYRPAAFVGFIIGTAYQYGLLKIMISLFYDSEVYNLPEYSFNINLFFTTLFTFIIVYEIFIHVFASGIKRISLKEVMLDE